jgi:ketosteroid isomerase-like protein
MADGNLELIQQGYEAFGRGDIAAVLDILSDDVEWSVTEVLPQGGRLQGKQEVAGFFERLVGIWHDLSLHIEDFCASGDRVCVIGSGSGEVAGERTGYGFVHAWTVADGEAVRFAEYADPAPGLYK